MLHRDCFPQLPVNSALWVRTHMGLKVQMLNKQKTRNKKQICLGVFGKSQKLIQPPDVHPLVDWFTRNQTQDIVMLSLMKFDRLMF